MTVSTANVNSFVREETVHKQICDYLRLHYPSIIFRTDFASGLKLTKYQAAMNKRLSSTRGYPDLFIAEPRGKYHGFFLEIKRPNATVYLKNGNLSSDPHIQEQASVLNQLRRRGYGADFGIGFEDSVRKITDYLRTPVQG